MKLPVNSAHLEKAMQYPWSSTTCLLRQALKDVVRTSDVSVNLDKVRIGEKKYRMSPDLIKLRNTFDAEWPFEGMMGSKDREPFKERVRAALKDMLPCEGKLILIGETK